jgi:hypothetical protein
MVYSLSSTIVTLSQSCKLIKISVMLLLLMTCQWVQSAPIDQQNINILPPALLRRYDVYIHAEKRIPVSDDDGDVAMRKGSAAAAAAAAAGVTGQQPAKGQLTREAPVTPLRLVSAQHIGKLVRVRVSCCQ